MSVATLLLTISTLLATPEIRRLGDECVVQASEIKRLDWRRNQGLWLWTTKGKVHAICWWASPSVPDTIACQPYLTLIVDAQTRGRKLTLTYPEHYDCRENFGALDQITPVLSLSVE